MTEETDDKSLTTRPATALRVNLAVAPRPRPAVPAGAYIRCVIEIEVLADEIQKRNLVAHIR